MYTRTGPVPSHDALVSSVDNYGKLILVSSSGRQILELFSGKVLKELDLQAGKKFHISSHLKLNLFLFAKKGLLSHCLDMILKTLRTR